MHPECEHPNCNNEAYSGICDQHINLILKNSNVVCQCANCGSLVAVYNAESINIYCKYIHSKRCRKCGGTIQDERNYSVEFPFDGRFIPDDKPDSGF